MSELIFSRPLRNVSLVLSAVSFLRQRCISEATLKSIGFFVASNDAAVETIHYN